MTTKMIMMLGLVSTEDEVNLSRLIALFVPGYLLMIVNWHRHAR